MSPHFCKARPMKHPIIVLAWLALVAACDGEGSSPIDGDAGPQADAGLDAGEPGEDGGAPDAGGDGGTPNCEVGATVTGSFGPSGGSIALCGASAELRAEVLDEERAVTLTIVALPAPAPYPLEAGGLAFALDVEGDLPVVSPAPLSVLVPHVATTRYRYFFRHDAVDGYQGIEACTAEETVIGQNVYTDGTYVALIDTEDFPTASEDLGTGLMESTVDTTVGTFDLASTEFDTYAIYDQGQDGSRNFTLAATKPEGESTLRLRFSFIIDAEGTPLLLEVSYGLLADVGGLWGYSVGDDSAPAPTFTLDTDDGAHVAGSFMAQIRRGFDPIETEAISVTFDATAGKFRYPPELACEIPEG
jgi:hypothetical protein